MNHENKHLELTSEEWQRIEKPQSTDDVKFRQIDGAPIDDGPNAPTHVVRIDCTDDGRMKVTYATRNGGRVTMDVPSQRTKLANGKVYDYKEDKYVES